MHVRLARSRGGRIVLAALLAAGSVAIAACHRRSPAESVRVAWSLRIVPPDVGPVTLVRMTLNDGQGRPIHGARLSLEAHMDHPGMAPALSAVTERDGIYEGRLRFLMRGNWTIVVSGSLPDGTRFTRGQRFEIQG